MPFQNVEHSYSPSHFLFANPSNPLWRVSHYVIVVESIELKLQPPHYSQALQSTYPNSSPKIMIGSLTTFRWPASKYFPRCRRPLPQTTIQYTGVCQRFGRRTVPLWRMIPPPQKLQLPQCAQSTSLTTAGSLVADRFITASEVKITSTPLTVQVNLGKQKPLLLSRQKAWQKLLRSAASIVIDMMETAVDACFGARQYFNVLNRMG